MKESKASLFELAFFIGLEKGYFNLILQNAKNHNDLNYDDSSYKRILLDALVDKFSYNNKLMNEYIEATKIAVLDYCLEEELIFILFDEEDSTKLSNLIKRRDMKSKLIRLLLSKCSLLMNYNPASTYELSKILQRQIRKAKEEIEEQYVLSTIKDFKDHIDNITSGINQEIYLNIAFNNIYYQIPRYHSLDERLCNYILEKYNYNISETSLGKRSNRFSEYNKSIRVLSLTMFDDASFWNFAEPYEGLSAIKILNDILEKNFSKHAQKLIDYIFSVFKNNKYYSKIVKNNLELLYLDKDILSKFKEQSFKGNFGRFSLSIDNLEEFKYSDLLLYPIGSKDKDYLEILRNSKIDFENFLKEMYKDNLNKVLEFIYNPDFIIQYKEKKGGFTLNEVSIGSYYDKSLIRPYEITENIEFFKSIDEMFFSKENIINRMLLLVYITKVLFKENLNKALYEMFYDMFAMINETLNITLAVHTDESLRLDKYNLLKEKLLKYNITPKTKDNYIISLLDRKVANYNEMNMFPILEQVGDAIYELVAMESIFYNPDENSSSEQEQLNKLVKAETQVGVAKIIELDKFYISNIYQILDKSKISDYDYIKYGLSVRFYESSKNKYLADSLEMIIASIYFDLGLEKAIDFTRKIFYDTFPKLKNRLTKPKFDYQDMIKTNLPEEYLNKIYPGLYEVDIYEKEYYVLWQTLSKLLVILSIGNETIEKRNYLTRYVGDIFGEIIEDRIILEQFILHDYLHNDFNYVYKKYNKTIKENYKKL